MYLNFQKTTTSTSTRRSPIIVNSEAIMMIETDIFFDSTTNTRLNVTRMDLSGGISVITESTFANISTLITMVDARSGSNNTTATTFGDTDYPWLRCNQIFNFSKTTFSDYAFNPQYLVCAEEVKFIDTINKTNETGLMISLYNSRSKNILTNLTYADLVTLLSASTVPIP